MFTTFLLISTTIILTTTLLYLKYSNDLDQFISVSDFFAEIRYEHNCSEGPVKPIYIYSLFINLALWVGYLI